MGGGRQRPAGQRWGVGSQKARAESVGGRAAHWGGNTGGGGRGALVGLWTQAGAPPRTPQGSDGGLAVDEGPGGRWAWGAAAQCSGSQGRVRFTDQNPPPSVLSVSCWSRSSAPALRRAPEKKRAAERPHPMAVRDVGNRAAQRPRDTENPGRRGQLQRDGGTGRGT